MKIENRNDTPEMISTYCGVAVNDSVGGQEMYQHAIILTNILRDGGSGVEHYQWKY